MKNLKLWIVSISVLALAPAPAAAQILPAPVEVTTSVEDLVVTARRTDAPIWEVTRGDSTLILVGNISGVPRDLDWRPEALEEVIRRADRILTPQYGSALWAM